MLTITKKSIICQCFCCVSYSFVLSFIHFDLLSLECIIKYCWPYKQHLKRAKKILLLFVRPSKQDETKSYKNNKKIFDGVTVELWLFFIIFYPFKARYLAWISWVKCIYEIFFLYLYTLSIFILIHTSRILHEE